MITREKQLDRRSRRTVERIRAALIELIMEKEPAQITVKEISERADINRKTFYMYFSNTDEIITDLLSSLADKLISVFRSFRLLDNNLDLFLLFERLNDILSEDLELYRRLNQLNLLPRITSMAKNAIIDLFIEEGNLKMDKNYLRYSLYAEYAAAGILSMLTKWFSVRSDISLNELTITAGKLTIYGLQSLIHIPNADATASTAPEDK